MNKYKIGDTVYYIQEYWNDATLLTERYVKRAVIEYMSSAFAELSGGVAVFYRDIYKTYEQAEARPKELKGESV